MLLVIAATEIEMKPFLSLCSSDTVRMKTIVSGVGPVESSVVVTRLLEKSHQAFDGVVNFGVGGAYLTKEKATTAEILDLCLAEKEFLGDYGVSIDNRIQPFADTGLAGPLEFPLDLGLLEYAVEILGKSKVAFSSGNFVTVNGASGTEARGTHLHHRFNGLCENMEGAAIARVCKEYSVPMLEVRVISNFVEDRPGTPWKLKDACERSAVAASLIVKGLSEVL